jgi:hypothetical protein
MKAKVLAAASLIVLVLAFLVSNGTENATAASVWPVTTDISPMYLKAVDSNSVSLSDCSQSQFENRAGKPPYAYIRNGQVTYSIGYNAGQGYSSLPSTAGCEPNTFVIAPNGTRYSTYDFDNYGDRRIIAEKSGNILWSKNIDMCTSSGYTYGRVYSIVMGSDGKLYALMYADSCNLARLYEINPSDGSVIGTAYTFPSVSSDEFSKFRLYSYTGEVVVRDVNSKYYYFTNGNTTTPASASYTALAGGTPYYSSKWVDASKNVRFLRRRLDRLPRWTEVQGEASQQRSSHVLL